MEGENFLDEASCGSNFKLLHLRWKKTKSASELHKKSVEKVAGGPALCAEIDQQWGADGEFPARLKEWTRWPEVPLPSGGTGITKLEALKKLWVICKEAKEACDVSAERVAVLKAAAAAVPKGARKRGREAEVAEPKAAAEAGPKAARKRVREREAEVGGGDGAGTKAAKGMARGASAANARNPPKRVRKASGRRGAPLPAASMPAEASDPASSDALSTPSDGGEVCSTCEGNCGKVGLGADCERQYQRKGKGGKQKRARR